MRPLAPQSQPTWDRFETVVLFCCVWVCDGVIPISWHVQKSQSSSRINCRWNENLLKWQTFARSVTIHLQTLYFNFTKEYWSCKCSFPFIYKLKLWILTSTGTERILGTNPTVIHRPTRSWTTLKYLSTKNAMQNTECINYEDCN